MVPVMTRRTDMPVRASLWLAAVCFGAAPSAFADDPAALEYFEKKVRPVLAEHCFKCHSVREKKSRGGLLLDSRDALLRGGDNGAVVVPGHPAKSRLVEAIGYQNVDLRMPPRGKLPEGAVADLTAWVKMGAPWPREEGPRAAVKTDFDLQRRKREHWAWRPVRPRPAPAVLDSAWPRCPPDRFLLARLEEKGLRPAPAADRRTLLRRVSFDLIGLPPTLEEVAAFVADASPDAYEKVVDRLLASPHFGERWGRHWLDLVRYAETRGHEFDPPIPNAHHYRDYVVRAFNADVPYDQFVVEHVAGDLLDKPRLHPTQGFNESVLGTGFWFLGEEVHSPVDVRQDQADRFDNRIDVMTKTFLGLTVACARCHDHKFDAISTRDYYALFGFLESSSYRQVRFDSVERERRAAEELSRLRERVRGPALRAVADGLRPEARRGADYLRAAREVLTGSDKPEAVAKARKIDPVLLARWVEHLRRADDDEDDPLHAWAKVAADAGGKDPARLADLLKPVVGRVRQRGAEALKGAEAVVDYAKARPGEWIADSAFGPGPVRPGDVILGGDPDRPLRVVERGAAEVDRAWGGLKAAPDTETEVGALAGPPRAGRTLRTPTFTVNPGRVFYLVRGAGRAYAAVGQHVLISGPLHGALVQPIQVGDRFRWVEHNLTPYRGLRAHVEFTPADGSDFAVAMVVQGEKAPGPADTLSVALLEMLAGAGSLDELAAGYQRLLLDTADRLADRPPSPYPLPHLGGEGRGRGGDARLAGWLVRHRGLFVADEGAENTRLAAAIGPFVAEQARLVTRASVESRLAPAMRDGSGQDEHVFIRGSPRAAGEVVPRRFLEALAGPGRLAVERGSGRLELARQMTDPALNPFVARVVVNRVWHHLFGRGLVASVDNFGALGEAPTHPEVLDHLADRFVAGGWSVKRLARSLVLSSAYRMESRPGGKGEESDPENLLLHRMSVRRLEGEAIRDAMLAVSGRLDRRMYGRAVPVYLTEFQDGRGRPPSGPLDGDGRRSVYLGVRRNFLSPLLLAFDTPAPFSTVGRRTVSNVPAQALILMNDPFVHQQAALWARRVLAQGGTPRERIAGMYVAAFGRPPTEDEVRGCVDFLGEQGRLAKTGPEAPGVWADLAHVLVNVKEFIFLN